jgi:hypothetical protein
MNEGTSAVSEVSRPRATPVKTAFGQLSNVTGVAGTGSESGNETRSAVRIESGTFKHDQASRHPRAPRTQGQPVDAALLTRAEETLKSLDDADELDVQLLLTGLVGIVSDMWESAVDASDIHQEILATLENGARVAAGRGRSLSAAESLAIRSAIHFLKQPRLVRSNAESVRSEFVEARFPPLGFLE